ncbi:MAG: hypothetical protein HBSAPP04_13830 [Ignavibacteriaceae bacterium]|nr:MAG: hypothetical protein HBSAPP04_13830 [Ignavibacteriaceae bacterium]
MSAKVARSLILFLFVLCPVIPAQKVTANKGVDPAFVSGQMNKAESYFKTGETDKGAVVLDSLREYLIRKFAFTRAIEVSRITLSLNEKIRNKKLIADAYNGMGNSFWRLGGLDSALHYLKEGVEFRKGVDDLRGLAVNHNLMGLVYWRKGDTEKSYRSYLNALAIRESLGDRNEISLINNNIGLIFQRMKYYDLAEQHIRKGMSVADSAGYETGKMYSLRRLIGLNIARKNYSEAMRYVDTVVGFYVRVNNKGSLAQLYNDLGLLNENSGKRNEAVAWYVKSRDLAKELGDRFIEAFALYNLGRVERASGDTKVAEESLNRGMELANSGGYHVILRDIYFELSILFQKRGDAREANNYLTRHLELKDSILSEGALTAIGEMRIRYEIERSKERQEYLESILEERNRTTLVLLILVVFFLGGGASIGFLFLRQKRLGRLLQVSNDELGKINLQLQKSNEALTLANETKTKLFSIIGHDLKSPFVSILGFSELLKDEADGMRNREISDLTEKILGSSVKLVDLVNNLTSWALQQREMLKPQPVFFGMEEVATVVMKAAMLNMELKGIVVRGEFGRPDVVFADREMISTVLRNILTNAIKFSFEGGEIVVRGEYLGEIYRVTIEDRGVGMSEDTIRNILYGSGTISTYGTANEKGTGLGLSVSRDFIRDNGGRLDIISEPGKGSSFIVEVPTS